MPFCPRDGVLTAAAPFSIGGRYRVEELLGAGGMAFVFGARHEVLGKPVALKILRREHGADPAQAQRFLREARIASQLHHPNIVNVMDFGHDAELDLNYLVMERLSGRTLAELIAASAPLPGQRALPILIQLARALEAAHAADISHRDLTPRNVMLVESSGRSDVVKLCDFGLSRLSSSADRITSTGAFLGTPAYAAPEQIRGDANQDQRVDLYALATIAYEMLTGKLPYDAPTSVALIAAKLTQGSLSVRTRAPGVTLPDELETWIAGGLERDPQQRVASAADSARLLGEILATPKPAGRGPDDLIGQTIGSYTVTSKLGSGGVGTVYLGEHPVIGNRVAIKVLQPEVLGVANVVDRFIEEARASSQLGSPYIARCQDFGFLAGGQPYAIMEYLDGETVAERLRRLGPLSVDEVSRIGLQVAAALAEAHAGGIIHRDIKPDNLMIVRGPDGADLVKVLDFGIAKLRGTDEEARMTSHGFVVGTLYYCAPEQLLGEDIGPGADVYALGATLFELLTGKPPFEGTMSEIAGAKLGRPAPVASGLRKDLPARVSRDVATMLERDPLDRPATMRAVSTLLAGWGTDLHLVEDELPSTQPSSRRRTTFALAIATLLVAIPIAIVAWPDRHAPVPGAAGVPAHAAPPAAPAAAPIALPAEVPPRPTDAQPLATSPSPPAEQAALPQAAPSKRTEKSIVKDGARPPDDRRASSEPARGVHSHASDKRAPTKLRRVPGGIVDPFATPPSPPPQPKPSTSPIIVNPFQP